MKKPIDRLKAFDAKSECVNVILETPKGSRVKYGYDEKAGLFGLSKALPEGMVFPFNFGFIPGTLAEDGDPLDVLILNEEPLVCGCLLKVRAIAVIKAKQSEDGRSIRNDRIIGQAIAKEAPPELTSIKLEKKTISQIDFFFTAYNKLYGKKFKVIGTGGAKKAMDIIGQAVKRRRKRGGK